MSLAPYYSVRRLACLAGLLTTAGLATSCARDEYRWAFAQELDNTFHPNELCRESLAKSIYLPANAKKTVREGNSNIFLYTGLLQSYRIYAFRTQQECETSLTNMRLRGSLGRGR